MSASHFEPQQPEELDLRERTRLLITDPTPVPVSLAFSSDGAYLAAGMRNGRVLVWDVAADRPTADWETRPGEQEHLLRVADEMMSRPDAGIIQTLIVPTFMTRNLAVHSVSFSPADALLCAAAGGGNLGLWTLSGRSVYGWRPADKPTRWATYCQRGPVIAYLNEEKGLSARDLFTERETVIVPFGNDSFGLSSVFAVAPDSMRVAVASHGELVVHQADRMPVRTHWHDWEYNAPHSTVGKVSELDDDRMRSDSIRSLAWNADETILTAANDVGAVQQWSLHDRLNLVHVGIAGADGRIAGLERRSGALVAIRQDNDGSLSLWDLDSEVLPLQSPGDRATGDVTATASHDPSNILAAGWANGEILYWNSATGYLIGHITGILVLYHDRYSCIPSE